MNTLISTDMLAANLANPSVVVVDCRFKLDEAAWGGREYAAGHVPGAVYAHLDRDLSGPKTGTNGRHPLPDPQILARTFGALGIAGGTQVVAYDQDNGAFASRLWWLLRWLGHNGIAVLDGGFAKWIAEGRPTAGGAEQQTKRTFIGSPRANMVVGAQDVEECLGGSSWCLADARAPERYRGDTEPLDNVAGHIPSAINLFFRGNLTESGTFHRPAELRERFQEALRSTPPERVICYCGSGVTACHNLLALEHAGLRGAKLYPGSWSEWSSDPSRPIEKSG